MFGRMKGKIVDWSFSFFLWTTDIRYSKVAFGTEYIEKKIDMQFQTPKSYGREASLQNELTRSDDSVESPLYPF